MLKHRSVLLLPLLVLASSAYARSSAIDWRPDPNRALNEAREALCPVMFYVEGARRDRNEELEDDQNRVLNDPAIIELSERYVCAKMKAAACEDILKQAGLTNTRSLNQSIIFLTPEGQLIDRLGAGAVAELDSMKQKMEAVLKKHRSNVFEQIKPQIEDEKTDEKELRKLFDIVEKLAIVEADASLVKALERSDLSSTARRQGYELLRVAATEKAVQALFTFSLSSNEEIAKDADKELKRCDPPAAPYLYSFLEDADKLVRAYEAIGDIGKVRQLKKASWWEDASDGDKAAEIERLKSSVKRSVEKWEEREARRRR